MLRINDPNDYLFKGVRQYNLQLERQEEYVPISQVSHRPMLQ